MKITHILKLAALAMLAGCTTQTTIGLTEKNWAEQLHYPPGKKVIILHADDAGMCEEANEATIDYLLNKQIQSTAAMAPTLYFEDFMRWAKAHPDQDVGLHLTLTSEWQSYRWGPVADAADVPGLVDPEGKFWRSAGEVVHYATPQEVERELRAQIEKSLALGVRPSHLDTHMGTLYGHHEFLAVFLKLAEEYGIPANAFELSDPARVAALRKRGAPVDSQMHAVLDAYTMPKLDDMIAVPKGSSYEELRSNFFAAINNLKPGLTEIYFHPSVKSDNLKTITNAWQRRVWEAQLFADPEVQAFFEQQQLVFTDWTEIMQRFQAL